MENQVKDEVKSEDEISIDQQDDWFEPIETDFGIETVLTEKKPKRKGKVKKAEVPISQEQFIIGSVSENGKERFACPICAKTFQDRKGVRDHAKYHHFYGRFNCQSCQEFSTIYANQLFLHVIENHSENSQCPNCKSQEFSDMESFQTHYLDCIRQKQREKIRKSYYKLKDLRPKKPKLKRFQCDECGKTFQSNSVLADHMNMHLGLKPYV